MISKKLSLILLAVVFVIEGVSLFWIRGDYRSTMLDGAEYEVPAAIDFKGIFTGEIICPFIFLSPKRPGRARPRRKRERKSTCLLIRTGRGCWKSQAPLTGSPAVCIS